MPVAPTYPGVYIQEIPSGARSIVGVATSITAVVGGFERGPVDTPVQLFNFGEFEREFGGLARNREASYQVRQFFLNGGSNALVVRVSPGGVEATATLQAADGSDVLRARAARRLRDRVVANPGSWANRLRLDVDYDTRAPASEFNLAVTETRDEDGREVVVRTETFRNLSMTAGAANDVLQVVNFGSRLIQLERDPTWTSTDRPAATGTLGAAVDTGLSGLSAVASTVRLTVGSVQTDLVVPAADLPATLAAARSRLESLIRDARPSEPLYAQASVILAGGRLRVLLGRSGADYDPAAIAQFSDVAGNLAATLGLTGAGAVGNVQQYALGASAAPVGLQGASTAGVDDTGATATALRGSRNAKSGMYALLDADLFNLLLIPEASLLDAPSDVTDLTSVMAAAITFAEEQRAFVLVDVAPEIDGLDAAQGWLDAIATAGLRHKNAAAYFPWPRIPDPLDENRLRAIGASGTVAGVYARTDAARGVWKAPAGIESSLRGVLELETKLSDAEQGVLNPKALNGLRTFDNIGTVVWGARTLAGADVLASEWKYVPVRRVALMIEESLYRGLQFAVFEPNDETLWTEIRLVVTAYMQGLFRQGAFQGTSPREAFLVKCDGETTTQADIDLGIVNVLVGFAPLKPAEFVVVSLRLLAGQAQS